MHAVIVLYLMYDDTHAYHIFPFLFLGLPVQVRDTALEEHEKLKIPQSDVGREYMIEQLEREQESVGGLANHAIGYGAASQRK